VASDQQLYCVIVVMFSEGLAQEGNLTHAGPRAVRWGEGVAGTRVQLLGNDVWRLGSDGKDRIPRQVDPPNSRLHVVCVD